MNNYSNRFSIIYDLLIKEDDLSEFLEKYLRNVQDILNLNSLVYYTLQDNAFVKANSYGADQHFADSMKKEGLVELFNKYDIIKLSEISPLNAFYKQHIAFAVIIRFSGVTYGMALVSTNANENDKNYDPQKVLMLFADLGVIISDFHNIRNSLINTSMSIASPVLRSLTHDVRNPIQMITILIEMLKAKELPLEKRLTLYNKLNDGITQIDKIATEISELFKDNYELDIDEVPSSVFFGEIKKEIQSSLAKLKIHFEMNNECAHSLEIDSEKMKDVIIRIIKYSRDLVQFDGLISLSAETQKDFLVITIADTSEGIDSKILLNQRNPFFNFGTRLGTGLNFSIMHKIIEAHQGTLTISNEEDGGAKFQIKLPHKIAK